MAAPIASDTAACCSPEGAIPCFLVGSPATQEQTAGSAFGWIFDTSPYPPCWRCGQWTAAIGWLHIVSDLLIWLAYMAIPVGLAFYAGMLRKGPYRGILCLFCAFILSCGVTHLMEVVIFWWPAYGLAGVLKAMTAVVSIGTVIAMARMLPFALTFRSPKQLEEEVSQRTRELELSERRAMSVIESSPAAMVMVDEAGCIVLVNEAAERLFGFQREELLGRLIESLLPERNQLVHPADRQAFFNAREARRMGMGRDLYVRRADGVEVPVEVGISPIETHDGMFALSAIVDMSERKGMECKLKQGAEELDKANQALRQSNVDLEQFAYAVSHDLQEPLRKIASYNQIVLDDYGDRLDDAGREFLQISIESSQRLKGMIKDLLAFSRITTKGAALKSIDAEEATDTALRRLEIAIEESNAQVSCDPMPHVLADAAQLERLLQNLVGNALKYRGEQTPKVHIGCRRLGSMAEFSISDNGIGIDPKNYSRVFGVFQRLHKHNEYEGTGIGLALCKRIVERFGGSISLESVLGEGSTFRFTLPLADEGWCEPSDASPNAGDERLVSAAP
ncbi:sensor histidine kinase [Pseudobythopirellula maris]|uniref:sensor histidine kinase n=1 Tax=Pseudobythopirellula maris TaxID=2527991 RepID=UPI0018D3D71D|nr:ATP-binding protein [Pseudobythopirellula maris]